MKKTYYFCPDEHNIWYCLSQETISEFNQQGMNTKDCWKEQFEDDETLQQCIQRYVDELNSPQM